MALIAGSRIGPYEISAPIGVGGMGEVYQATDRNLGRQVAIKVLPAAVAQDAERVARFEREAKTLALLNHPNIAQVYGLEQGDGLKAIVMELVEGPTLADRIAQGPIPLDETLPIAKQIVEALEAAHAQGVIHRDLKPSNIKLRPDGTVKVLDFGLAKALEPASVTAGDVTFPTITSPALMTGVGVLLGTAAYMSPEQAKGKAADRRADVWAFGCVLYEMLSGQRAFDGDDTTDVLGAVVRLEPAWAALPADVPPALRTLVQRCLVKDRLQRVSEIAAAKFVLNELASFGAPLDAPTATVARSRWKRALPAIVTAALTAGVVGAVAWALRPATDPPVVAKFSFALPEGQSFTGSRRLVAVSPDGTRLAYLANSRVYVRSIDDPFSHELPGTAAQTSAQHPMFGPDGQSIAFVQAPGIVKKIRGDGSTPTEIARLPNARRTGDMTWGPAGILIAVWGQGILRLSPDGGFLPEEPVVSVGPDERVLGPQMLPDGRRVLFTVSKGDGDNLQEQVVVQSLDGGTRTVLREGGSGRYLPTGHLLYAIAGTIYAVAFDAASLESRGSEVPVVPGVRRSPHGVTHLAVSDTGTLVYIPGPANTTIPMFGLALSDGRSNPAELKVAPAAYSHPRVSPDGLRLAVGRNDGRDSDIWTYDLGGKTEIRNLTLDGSSRFPVWSHNSRRITFQSSREGDRGIYWQPVDGGRADRLTKAAEGEEHVPEAWSPDGRHLLFSVTKELKNSLMVFTLDSRKTDAFGGMPSAEPLSASFSEDGRWVAYAFAERAGQRSPKSGIFVEPFPPATGEKRRVPDSFIDFHPVWSPDGKSIFYVQASSQPIVAVPVTRQPTLDFEKPVEILRGPMPTVSQTERRGYDVLKDGRFISLTPAFEGGQSVHVWLNWFEELKRLVPAR